MPYDHLASIPKGKTAQATLEVQHSYHLPFQPMSEALHSHESYTAVLRPPCYIVSNCKLILVVQVLEKMNNISCGGRCAVGSGGKSVGKHSRLPPPNCPEGS